MQKEDSIEFHIEYLDIFIKITKDWLLKGTMSIRRNLISKICIVLGEAKSIFLPYSLKSYY